jgi:hypothetical protein
VRDVAGAAVLIRGSRSLVDVVVIILVVDVVVVVIVVVVVVVVVGIWCVCFSEIRRGETVSNRREGMDIQELIGERQALCYGAVCV